MERNNNYEQWVKNYKTFFENSLNYKEMPELQDEMYDRMQNKIWYSANSGLELVRFYHTVKPKDNLPYKANQFYNVAFKNIFNDDSEVNKPKITPVHVDVAKQITKTMVKLVFSGRPTFSIITGNDSENEELELSLEDMLDANNFDSFIQDSAEKLSYSGAIAIKYVLDSDESDYPIMVTYPKEDIEVIKKYGNRISSVIFKDYYRLGTKRYCLYTIYGKGFIDYKLYSVGKDLITIKKEVPLDTLEETAELTPVYFYNPDGTPCKEVMATYIENKTDGKSDYAGCIDEFIALDEIRSNLILFLRTAKVKQYFHDNMLVTDGDKLIVPDTYDTDNIIIHDSNPNWTENEIKRDVVDINNSVTGYKMAFEDILLQLLTACGLSPSSLGYDVSGANSSGLALEIRERASLDTRSEKCQRWNEALIDIVNKLFIFANLEVRAGAYIVKENEFDVSIQFADYRRSLNEIIDDMIKRLENQLIDLDTAYDIIYPELSEEEKELMIQNVQGLLKEDTPEDDVEVEETEVDEDINATEEIQDDNL